MAMHIGANTMPTTANLPDYWKLRRTKDTFALANLLEVIRFWYIV